MKRSIVKLTLAAFFLGLWLLLVDTGEVVSLLRGVRLVWLLPVVAASVAIELIAALRFMILVSPFFPGSFMYFFKLSLVGIVASLVTPAQGGGFLRAYLVKKKYNTSFSRAFGFVLVDFLFAVAALFFMGLVGVIYFVSRGVGVVFKQWVAVAAAGLMVAGLVGILRPRLSERISFLFLNAIAPKRLQRRLRRPLEEFWRAFSMLSSNPGRLVLAFILSLIIVVFSGLAFFFIVRSFGAALEPTPVILVAAIGGLINMIPAAPGKVGQYELVGLVVLATFLGIERNLAGGVALLAHVFEVSLVLITAGLVFVFLTSEKHFEELRALRRFRPKIKAVR